MGAVGQYWAEANLGVLEQERRVISQFKIYQINMWLISQDWDASEPEQMEIDLQDHRIMKKEVAYWYQLLLIAADDERKVPYSVCDGYLLDVELEELWKVSLSILSLVAKPAALSKNQFFTFHKAYWTPKQLAKLRGSGLSKCKQCSRNEAGDMHMFATTPNLEEF
ncbi:hypothetical protein NDU88_005975 [Pleurodeles waltl]|uniref:Uncharacterized protein n=1 Tax=Pleurodeles waltl TaxID=8319 RepID=A0AAV7MDN3_PLEWA|nr:hypothetical protein NDU88_005975 [Pleurodeles waltl]